MTEEHFVAANGEGGFAGSGESLRGRGAMESTARIGCATVFKGRTARGGKPPVPALETGQFRSCSPSNMAILESGYGLRCPLLYSLVQGLVDSLKRVATDHREMAFWPNYETKNK
jgi:hypothetical protein